MDTLESLHRKIGGASELKSVVRTMKALAASNIGQYENAVSSLQDYYYTIALGIRACFKNNVNRNWKNEYRRSNEKVICAIVFGSDQGLVGQFNDSLSSFLTKSFDSFEGKKEIWAVGERIELLLNDAGFSIKKSFPVPTSVKAITALATHILIQCEENFEKGIIHEFYIFHNQQKKGSSYFHVKQGLLPLEESWQQGLAQIKWPDKKIAEVIGEPQLTIQALVHEFLFVSLFKACAESLASENSSRLSAMQRAEKNIEELLDNLSHKFHRLRQSSIDEELFDVVSGFEALKNIAK